jgi:hypothetical protein
MSTENKALPVSVIFDSKTDTKILGKYVGAIITKFFGETPELIISDNLIFEENLLKTKGLHIGIKEGKAFSLEQDVTIQENLNRIDFCIRIPDDVVQAFDSTRFDVTYGFIVRFGHTACLYADLDHTPINHMEFVRDEIINRPIVLKKDGGVCIADRLVVTDIEEPMLYSAIYIQRLPDQPLEIGYEPMLAIKRTEIAYILLLGSENF